MKVGVLGSGEVGRTLAEGFLRHGHQVLVGSRTAGKLADWAKNNPSAKTGTFADAAAFGEVIVLAVKGAVAKDALNLATPANLKGKTIIDATNPIDAAPPENGVIRFFTDLNNSLMEQLQSHVSDANFVKAFSCVGSSLMVDPQVVGGPPTMFICGNDDAAKRTVRTILEQFGWEVSDMGKAEAARAIEPLCILWCIPGFLSNDWRHALKMLPAK
jgi:predicted dinucleotide-binding enzyme